MLKSRTATLFVMAILSFTPLSAHAETIYLVPVGKLESIPVYQLKTYYRDRFDVTVETLPLLPFDQATYDPKRKQLIAEELVAQIRRGYPKQAQDEGAILIGLTDGDMYIRAMDWQFAFNYRPGGERIAMISSARMNPVHFGEPADEKLLQSRVRKMLTKDIGIMHFKKEPSTNPKSVLYNRVLGLEDLDNMGEDF